MFMFFSIEKKKDSFAIIPFGGASRTIGCIFVTSFTVCVCAKGSVNRAQSKADFPTFVSIPVERNCFETANFKLISLQIVEKGRTRINFF